MLTVGMSGFGKIVIGQPGKKYGLHRPGQASKTPVRPSIFNDEGEDEESQDPAKVVMSDKHREKMQKRAEKEMAKALAVDSSIFDYDGAHDSIVAEREKAEQDRMDYSKKKKEVSWGWDLSGL